MLNTGLLYDIDVLRKEMEEQEASNKLYLTIAKNYWPSDWPAATHMHTFNRNVDLTLRVPFDPATPLDVHPFEALCKVTRLTPFVHITRDTDYHIDWDGKKGMQEVARFIGSTKDDLVYQEYILKSGDDVTSGRHAHILVAYVIIEGHRVCFEMDVPGEVCRARSWFDNPLAQTSFQGGYSTCMPTAGIRAA
ncbi:hypothetical protein AB6D11_00970 [Vibrio splendidus]